MAFTAVDLEDGLMSDGAKKEDEDEDGADGNIHSDSGLSTDAGDADRKVGWLGVG